jgi:hypothetical protein
MRHTGMRGLPGSNYYSTLPHKRQEFREKIIGHKISDFRISLQILSETFLIL